MPNWSEAKIDSQCTNTYSDMETKRGFRPQWPLSFRNLFLNLLNILSIFWISQKFAIHIMYIICNWKYKVSETRNPFKCYHYTRGFFFSVVHPDKGVVCIWKKGHFSYYLATYTYIDKYFLSTKLDFKSCSVQCRDFHFPFFSQFSIFK